MRNPILAMASLALFVGCAELPDIVANKICGNGVIEPENLEDCEPDKELPDGLRCGESADELACRFVCGDDGGEGRPVSACPAGWGCALEGYCQPASGRFDNPLPVPGITTPLGIGDFDGDAYPDLVTVQEPLVSVAYGNFLNAYQVGLVAPIDSSPNDPVIGDINGDGNSDLVVNAGDRLNVYLGGSNQTLTPLMVPSQIYPELPDQVQVVAVALDDVLGRQLPLMLALDGDTLSVYFANSTLLDQEPLELASPGTELAQAVATGDFLREDEAPDARDHEMAIAPHRANAVALISLYCDVDDVEEELGQGFEPPCEIEEVGQIPVPMGWQLSAAGTFAADVDGDGHTDLVFGLQGPPGKAVGAALGQPDGGFAAATVLPVPYASLGPGAPMMPGAQVMNAPPWLLAVEDLDGDGLADIVTAEGVLTATRAGPDDSISYETTFRIERRWDGLRVADLNRDGLPDMVGLAGPSILVHLNVDGLLFNTSETTVDAQNLALQIGDFDGDLFPDLLLAVENRLLIGFNNGRGLTGTFREALSVNGNLDTAVLRLLTDVDATDDIALVVREADRPPYLLELEGSGTRRLAAPLRLPMSIDATLISHGPQGATQPFIGERTMAGWLFRTVDPESIFTALVEEPPAIDMEGDCDFAPMAGLISTSYLADPDDAYTTLAVVEQNAPDIPAEFTGPWVPRVVAYTGDGVLSCTALGASPLPSSPEQIRIADLDGDAAPDLMIAHPAERTPGADLSTEGGLVIYWGDGDGGFDPQPDPLPLVAPGTDGSDRQGEFRGIFTTLETNGRPGDELLAMFGSGLYFIAYDVEADEFGTPVRRSGQSIEPESITRIDAVDLDVDGVTDVVLSGPRQTLLLLQAPCTALEADEGECTRTVIVEER